MKNKSKLKLVLENLEEIIASLFLIITTSLVVLNVFLRYFMKTGLSWSEEVATICFVWAVFIGAAASFKRGKHIGVDIIVNKLPDNLRNIVKITVDMILILLNGYITYISVVYVSLSQHKMTPVLGISSVYVSSSLVISFLLITIYSVKKLLTDIKTIKQDKEEKLNINNIA